MGNKVVIQSNLITVASIMLINKGRERGEICIDYCYMLKVNMPIYYHYLEFYLNSSHHRILLLNALRKTHETITKKDPFYNDARLVIL